MKNDPVFKVGFRDEPLFSINRLPMLIGGMLVLAALIALLVSGILTIVFALAAGWCFAGGWPLSLASDTYGKAAEKPQVTTRPPEKTKVVPPVQKPTEEASAPAVTTAPLDAHPRVKRVRRKR